MKRLLIFLLLLAAATSATAQVSSDGLWQDVSESSIAAAGIGGPRVLFPRAFRLLTLDLAGFRSIAANATVISLPMPDGSFQRFALEESPIMTPDLAAKLPGVKTWKARGLDDRTATARIDVTPEGFHGFILSPNGNVLIDPYQKNDTAHYMSYWRRDYARTASAAPFFCDVAKERTSQPRTTAAQATANGATLRTYRLALAATGEYTQFHGGTVAGAQAAMVTTMNRVNGVFEQELAVRMTMIDNTAIVFTDPGTDPYDNDSGDLGVNQSTIDSLIGNASYDIGHLFGTGGGGVASLGVPCSNGVKARGLTGSPSPVNDAFDIDYVAHEMGHQFGADHSFNGTTANCGKGNRSSLTAYEPGSGSTIMAYAGICGAENLQPHSDAYFHTISFDEIVAFITTDGNPCAVSTATGNSAPTVTPGDTFTIPMQTPFYITGSAVDPNGNDVTYDWEQFDRGSSAPPNTDNGNRPIFRSFNPTTSPTRTFPKLSDLLSNVSTIGESLPATTRALTFRLTARDNLGGVNYATRSVSVTSSAGPFAVTSPNTAVSLPGGSTQTVTWSVAGTTAAPVSCANVMILLSTDGGTTFPSTLLASTANDGSEPVTLPNLNTTLGRVRVECTTAPFFDISNANFSIQLSLNVVATATSPTSVGVTWSAIPGAVSYEVYRRAAGGTFTLIGTSPAPGYTDSTAAADTAYLYAVKWIDGSSVASALSAPDLATTVIFTDSSLSGVIVKVAHAGELRTAVNAVRALAGLGAASFTDSVLIAGITPVKAVHVTELRTALDAARSLLSLAAASYVDPSLVAGTAIKAAHLEDLRAGVK